MDRRKFIESLAFGSLAAGLPLTPEMRQSVIEQVLSIKPNSGDRVWNVAEIVGELLKELTKNGCQAILSNGKPVNSGEIRYLAGKAIPAIEGFVSVTGDSVSFGCGAFPLSMDIERDGIAGMLEFVTHDCKWILRAAIDSQFSVYKGSSVVISQAITIDFVTPGGHQLLGEAERNVRDGRRN